MSGNVLAAFGPLVLILVGFLLLWRLSRSHRRSGTTGNGAGTLALTVVGWVLLLLGIFALVGVMTHVFFVFTWLVTAVVLLAAVHRYRRTERHALLWSLMAAAERDIPLETAARAYADERNDLVGQRALKLADYLEAGVPLSLALQRSRIHLPAPALLAADLGQQTGTLGMSLRQVVSQMEEYETDLRSILEKLFYLGFLVFWAIGILTFVLIKLVPQFTRMFEEFALALPTATILLTNTSKFLLNGWPLVLPILGILLLLLVSAVLYYTGLTGRGLPGLGYLWWRTDCALVQRWLAISVRQRRPMAETVRLLAGFFPHPRLRGKLDWAARRMDGGADWCVSLQQAGLVRRAEGVVFKSAERVGNLAWALEEMADSNLRRSAYRLRAFVSVAFPAVLLVFGACIFFIAMGVLMPLFSLIQGLT